MSSGLARKPSVECLPVAPQYEMLRRAALGEPLPPEARSGLVVFLRRGMWAWARSLLDASALCHPSRPQSSRSTAPDPHQHRAVIAVFAAMALSAKDGRAQ